MCSEAAEEGCTSKALEAATAQLPIILINSTYCYKKYAQCMEVPKQAQVYILHVIVIQGLFSIVASGEPLSSRCTLYSHVSNMPPQIYEDGIAFVLEAVKCANSCVHEYKYLIYNSLCRGLH